MGYRVYWGISRYPISTESDNSLSHSHILFYQIMVKIIYHNRSIVEIINAFVYFSKVHCAKVQILIIEVKNLITNGITNRKSFLKYK